MQAPVVVFGQIGRDLVLRVDEMPERGSSAPLTDWWEVLGGKGANQAVGLRQLGNQVALVGVVGADESGDRVLEQAIADGIDVDHVARRGRTALLVDVVEDAGRHRLLEGVPAESLLRSDDVTAAEDACRAADTVVLQLQQPAEALLRAAQTARDAGGRVVLDGGVEGAARDALLGLASVVRADATEAAMFAGAELPDRSAVEAAAQELLAVGPEVVALAVTDDREPGDLVAWRGGQAFFAHERAPAADPTGAGDAFVAGLVTGLRAGAGPEAAGRLATQAAAASVRRVGGRPDLTHLAAASRTSGGRTARR